MGRTHQIGNAYQRVREVWHDTLNMDRVLTLEDIGLYETRDTVELFWSIIYRLVVLTVSIIHYNVLHWSWRRVEWAAKTLQVCCFFTLLSGFLVNIRVFSKHGIWIQYAVNTSGDHIDKVFTPLYSVVLMPCPCFLLFASVGISSFMYE